mgnify:CR=1 FL=1
MRESAKVSATFEICKRKPKKKSNIGTKEEKERTREDTARPNLTRIRDGKKSMKRIFGNLLLNC